MERKMLTIKNNKKNRGIIIAIAVIIATIVFFGFFQISSSLSNGKPVPVPVPDSGFADVTWNELEGGNSEESVIEISQLVAKGKVLSQKANQVKLTDDPMDEGLFFTESLVEVTEVQAKAVNINESLLDVKDDGKVVISVIQTGAIIDGEMKNVVGDAPLLVNGKSYILFLDEFDEERFVPVGGRFGTAEIVNGEIEFTNDYAAEIMTDFEGEKAKNVISEIAKISDTLNEDIVVNEDKEAPSAFIE
jgi:hypothetical protein